MPQKKTKIKRKRVKIAKRPPRGDSIEKRPLSVLSREEFGHWEMDCVEGKKGTKKTLLVFTERKTRLELIRIMSEKTSKNVVKALDRLEQKFGAETFSHIFKSITVDNGSEFENVEGIERSTHGGTRTKVYYCHPYSGWERGSNENQNKLIRRHYPKGCDFTHTTAAEIQKVEDWINNYPRKMFDYCTSAEMCKSDTDILCVKR